MAERHAAVGECLSALEAQWAPNRDERFAGFPSVEAPPVILGVNSRRLASLAGERTSGVNVRWNHPDRAAILASAITASRGRPGWWTTFGVGTMGRGALRSRPPAAHRVAAEGVDRLILAWPEPPSTTEIERGGRRLG